MALAMACVAAMEVFTAEAAERARLEWAMSEEQIASGYRQIRAAMPWMDFPPRPWGGFDNLVDDPDAGWSR